MNKQITGNKYSVAVVIPYYNGSQWIERAVQSVATQTVPADEFIIVNDGSAPEERAKLNALSQQYGFRILDKENGGQGSARNAGAQAAQTTFIAFLDQDDYFLPHHIEDLLNTLPNDDARLGYVYGNFCEADENGKIFRSHLLRDQKERHPKSGHVIELIKHDMFVLPSAALISKKAFDAVAGFDPQFTGYEDDDLFLRMFRAGFSNYYTDKPVYVWCQHFGSTSWSIKMSRSRIRYFRKLLQEFPDDPRRSQYFMRDALIPRFGATFLREAIMAKREGSLDQEEILAILNEYNAAVLSNPFVKPRLKRNLHVVSLTLTRFPYGFYRVLKNFISVPGHK